MVEWAGPGSDVKLDVHAARPRPYDNMSLGLPGQIAGWDTWDMQHIEHIISDKITYRYYAVYVICYGEFTWDDRDQAAMGATDPRS